MIVNRKLEEILQNCLKFVHNNNHNNNNKIIIEL